MSLLAGLLGLALFVPAAAEEGPSEGLPPGEMFGTLFKHVEPHAVGALWFGGDVGLGFVSPYVHDADGEPVVDAHGHHVAYHSSAELTDALADEHGGGRGILIYNINTAQWIAATVLIVILLWATRQARRYQGGAPKGTLFHMVESTILYVRDDMVYAIMGREAGRRFLPFFLTMFFFILFMNLLGLVPDVTGGFGGTATANLAVTGGLALMTLLWIHVVGIREHGFFRHWANFIPHGLPWFALPIIIPVEVVGMVVKPVALTIRLFANMLAGHLVILSFFGLAYMGGTWLIAPLPIFGALFIASLEVFVALVQAWVFTYLSILFIGASVHPEH